MKRIVLFSAVVFAVAGGVTWGLQSYSYSWEPRSRHFFEQQLSTALGTHVEIGHLSYEFPRSISVNSFTVTSPLASQDKPLFFSSSVQIALSLIDVPQALLNRHPIQLVGHLIVQDPQMVLSPAIIDYYKTFFAKVKTKKNNKKSRFGLIWNGLMEKSYGMIKSNLLLLLD